MAYKLLSDKKRSNRIHDLRTQFGLTHYVFEDMKRWQDYKCVICLNSFDDGKRKACVDHNHDATQKVRGVLCRACNGALGLFGDNIETLKNAIEYLNK